MGNTLDKPITNKSTTFDTVFVVNSANDEKLSFGVSSMQGWRIDMEDSHIVPNGNISQDTEAANNSGPASTNPSEILPGNTHSLFVVFDGHGGKFASEYGRKNFCRILFAQPEYSKLFHIPSPTPCQAESRCQPLGGSKTKARNKKVQKKKNQTGSKNLKNNLSQTKEECRRLLELALQKSFVQLDEEMLKAMINEGIWKEDTTENCNVIDSCTDWEMSFDSNGHDEDVSEETVSNKSNSSNNQDNCEAGTTAIAVLITPWFIVCANVGDSRALLCRRCNLGSNCTVNKAIALSFDHKPDNLKEKQRIENAGGSVNFGRVDGELAVSRALGDYNFKNTSLVITDKQEYETKSTYGDHITAMQIKVASEQKVTPTPEIVFHDRDHQNDQFVILACDGIWDVLTNDEIVSIVSTLMVDEGETNLGLICEEVLDICLKKGSRDNMTIIVVTLPNCESAAISGGGVMKRRKRRGVVG